ncbi:MAG: trypsin-like peptidase domain-containing protein [bacterium]|nr:trypsin-like peptidase domain-containing protein [bacterium]
MNKVVHISLAVAVAFVFGIAGGYLGSLLNGSDDVRVNSEGIIVEEHSYIEESMLIDAIDRVAPSVVSVLALQEVPLVPFYDPSHDRKYILGYEPQEVSGGTGFIVTADGLIMTNKHVVENEEAQYVVVFHDGTQYDVEVVSKDPFDDVAVLRIVTDEEEKFPTVEFGDSDDLQIGQKVFAIGNALAMYGHSVTSGIISAKEREVSAYNEVGDDYENLFGLLQTDAAINFGNSGGPLVDLNGNVVGMSVATAEFGESIGFVIPVNDLKPTIKNIEEHGEILRPILGVRFVMLTPSQAEDLELSVTHGAIVISGEFSSEPAVIEGGSADKAGIREMDVILEVDGKELSLENPLHKVIRNYNPGDTVEMKILRGDKEILLDVELQGVGDL